MAEGLEKKLNSFEQAIRDLTFNISPEEGGTYNEESKVNCPDPWHPLKAARDGYGRHTVIYSFDAKEPRSLEGRKYSVRPRAFNEEQRVVMREVMNAAEEVANIRFVEAGKSDYYFPTAGRCKPEDAHLCFFQDNNLNDGYYGQAGGMENRAGGRDILIYGDHAVVSNFVHELSHAVAGISHPQNKKEHLDYTKDSTVMTINTQWYTAHFGQYDIATWQYIFGKSQSAKRLQPLVTGEEAMHTPVINRSVPVTLDLRDLHNDQQTVTVDLARELGRQVHCSVVKPKEGKTGELNITFAPDTEVRSVLPVQNAVMHMRGRRGVYLTGDKRSDMLMAQGGNNVLTGGERGDSFRFDKNSGHGNVITDFTVSPFTEKQEWERKYLNDRIEFIIPELDHINLQRHNSQSRSGPIIGTQIQAVDAKQKVLASAFVANQKPEQLKDHIFKASVGNWEEYHANSQTEEVKMVEVEPPPSTPPVQSQPQPRLRLFRRR